MTRSTNRSLALLLGTGPHEGATVAALRLAEAAVARGHRVAVYAYGDGLRTAAAGAPTAPVVERLLRAGIHGGGASWIVDEDGLRECAAGRQAAGVVHGTGGDLWRLVQDADVALGVAH